MPGNGLELAGRLYQPRGPGPFPAVVLLHGCSGMWDRNGKPNANYDHWARRLRDAGFIALLLDSFGPRGEREICTQADRRVRPGRERRGDALAALAWLTRRPDVDTGRVHVRGWSNGGTTVLHVAAERPGAPRFRSAIAFYPGCRVLARSPYKPGIPLLILAGDADDWTPAAHCEALAEGARTHEPNIDIEVYPGAHHAFDAIRGRERFRPDVSNPTNATGRGATVGPHPEARDKAWARALEFLQPPAVPRGTSGPPP